MIISLIVAVDEAGGIGYQGKLPWRLATDMKRFKRLTMGHHLVMGRKTWETIRQPLPGRTMIVVTRNTGYQAAGCQVVNSLPEAIELGKAHGESELFVIGGAELFQQALPLAQRIYLTAVHAVVPADTYFPKYDRDKWKVVRQEEDEVGGKNEYAATFLLLERYHGS